MELGNHGNPLDNFRFIQQMGRLHHLTWFEAHTPSFSWTGTFFLLTFHFLRTFHTWSMTETIVVQVSNGSRATHSLESRGQDAIVRVARFILPTNIYWVYVMFPALCTSDPMVRKPCSLSHITYSPLSQRAWRIYLLDCRFISSKRAPKNDLNKTELYFSLICQYKESRAHVKTQVPSVLLLCHLQYVALNHLVQDGSPHH